MVTIRLSRGGAKKQPFYHIVAADSRKRRDGRYIERLGFFNPVARGQAETLRLDLALVDKWLGNGAQTTERAAQLIKQARCAAQAQPAAAAGADAVSITETAAAAAGADAVSITETATAAAGADAVSITETTAAAPAGGEAEAA